MKRVLFVDHVNRILGGAEVNLLELQPVIRAQEKWQPGCACSHGSALSDALAPLAIPQYDYGFPKELNEARFVNRGSALLTGLRGMKALKVVRQKLEQVVVSARPHAIISCTNKDHFCAGPVGRRHLIPSVWWVNDVISPDFFSWPVRAAFCYQARRYASRLVVVSEYARAVLVREGLAPELVRVIHNGVPLPVFDKKSDGVFRELSHLPADEPLIGMVGRYTPWKGQELFLRVAQAWIRESPVGHFILVGQAFNEDQAYELALRKFVTENQLEKRVHFIPFQTNIATVLRELAVLVHASTRPEPFGRVIIEAMAAGVPVIAARSGGVQEIFTHEVDGLFAEPGNANDYLAQLRRLLTSEKERLSLGLAGRRTVEQKFTVERVWQQFESVLAEVT